MRDPKEIERNAISAAMNDDFENGKILNASEEVLQKYLWYICTERIDNETVRHRAIARALTINHLQMQMHINKLMGNRVTSSGVTNFSDVLSIGVSSRFAF